MDASSPVCKETPFIFHNTIHNTYTVAPPQLTLIRSLVFLSTNGLQPTHLTNNRKPGFFLSGALHLGYQNPLCTAYLLVDSKCFCLPTVPLKVQCHGVDSTVHTRNTYLILHDVNSNNSNSHQTNWCNNINNNSCIICYVNNIIIKLWQGQAKTDRLYTSQLQPQLAANEKMSRQTSQFNFILS